MGSEAEGDNRNRQSLEENWKPKAEEKENVIKLPERENEIS